MRNAVEPLLSLLLLQVLLLVGCATPRSTAGGDGKPVSPSSLYSLPAADREIGYLSGSVRMKAEINGESASAKGRIRIREGKGVQISATAMGLMEAACFEFLPRSVRFIYKIDKIYADSPYSGVPFLYQTGCDYGVLESVLLNRMFSPAGAAMPRALRAMDVADTGECFVVTTPQDGRSTYRFYIEKLTGNLVRCEGDCAGGGNVVCTYSDFDDFDGEPFPRVIDIRFNGEGTSASLTLKLSGLKSSEFSFTQRKISSSYDRVSFEGVIGSVGTDIE